MPGPRVAAVLNSEQAARDPIVEYACRPALGMQQHCCVSKDGSEVRSRAVEGHEQVRTHVMRADVVP